jgi:transglutaminase-like putative cysteine protease
LRRTLLATGVAGAVIAGTWLNFEEPVAAPARAVALVVLAMTVTALPSRRLRAAGSVIAGLVAVWLAFGVGLPLHPVGGASAVWTSFDSGFLDFYSTHLPFDPSLHTDMTKVVLFAVFAFTFAVGLFAAARKPVAAALVLLVGAGWPATLIVPKNGTVMGALILAAALVVLAAAGSRRITGYAAPFALALVVGGVIVGTATASNHPVLDWQSWNVAGVGARNVVQFVWDARYSGLHWPKRTTTMLEVRSSTEPAYLRAAVLDDFVGGKWIVGAPRAADALEPAAAFRPDNQQEQVVTVDGLTDTRLLAGEVPVRFSANSAFAEPERGLAAVPGRYGRGFQYTAWSYAVSPSARALSRSPARYPAELLEGGMLDVGDGIRVPAFGVPGRDAAVASSLSLTIELADYVRLARLADRVTRGAKTPYAATVDLERWFLVGGGFTYSNHPPVVAPPLVGFATTTRSGYCQYFAGAMALMLRYVGIPARVAVGFAGPSLDPVSDEWKFTDRNAHAWVEVWFAGYGWLPFDPTPATRASSRGRLIAGYTRTPNSGGRGGSSGGGSKAPTAPVVGTRVGRIHLGGRPRGDGASPVLRGGGGFPYTLFLLLVPVGIVGAIALAKEARRRMRRRASDPRRIAAACRDELVSFLLDQGIDSPPSATVRELGLLAHRQLGADVDEFVAATTAARFGRPEAAAAAARVALRESGPLFASCRRFLGRRERLRGLLSLRSLVRVPWTADGAASLGSARP